MSIDSLFKETKNSFQKTLDWFKKEISAVRGNRVSIDLIDGILLDYYGEKISLKEIASLSLVDSRTISIEPWDKSVISNIEKALQESNLGGNVKDDGGKVFFTFSIQTTEDKEKMIKILRQKMEKAKVALRRTRDEVWKEIQEMERKGEIPEDEKFRQKDNLQKLINEFEDKIEEIEKAKEKEILE
ncbi:MAG TPA: ribosome-recycling factor [Candidatus Pacearchaeota archaeon]|nr:ribosome-recycling factor [Candidatus Pacearchaeota archaeon]HOK94198.1 ribosome-recycling factor [Candidatus Pacearchaeota archaeon]HPO75418.1 ribosome-recycling factor [Candidatus Pacearchaeota archaeon]